MTWVAVHTWSKAEADVRRDSMELGAEVFLPNYGVRSVRRGKPMWRHHALMPGYLFAKACVEVPLGEIARVRGVVGVLGCVADSEIARMMENQASGLYNVTAVHRDIRGRYTKRRRRPRPGKAIREKLMRSRAHIG